MRSVEASDRFFLPDVPIPDLRVPATGQEHIRLVWHAFDAKHPVGMASRIVVLAGPFVSLNEWGLYRDEFVVFLIEDTDGEVVPADGHELPQRTVVAAQQSMVHGFPV